MSPTQKRRLARKAKAAKLTMGEFLRRGGENYVPDDTPALLDHVAKDVVRATHRAIRSIDKTLSIVTESAARMHALNQSRKKTSRYGALNESGMRLQERFV
jgi:hypothetical protein